VENAKDGGEMAWWLIIAAGMAVLIVVYVLVYLFGQLADH
jgi:hypothetical protein